MPPEILKDEIAGHHLRVPPPEFLHVGHHVGRVDEPQAGYFVPVWRLAAQTVNTEEHAESRDDKHDCPHTKPVGSAFSILVHLVQGVVLSGTGEPMISSVSQG